MDPDLMLEKAKKSVRQKEAVREQHLQLKGEGSKKNPIVLDEIKEEAGRSETTPKANRKPRCNHRKTAM